MATRKSQPGPVVVSWNRELPQLAQAASIALAVLTHVKLPSIDDLKTALDDGDERVRGLLADVRLSDEARQLLADKDIAAVLGLLRARTNSKDGRQHMLTVAVCPVCGEWTLVCGTGGPTRCLLRRGCPGRPVKAAPGSRDRVKETDATPPDPIPTGAHPASPVEQPPAVDEEGSAWDCPGPDDGADDPFG